MCSFTKERERAGPYYPLGTISTVPRVYEGMEGRKNKNKEIKNRKIK
jgi:hypothetical protein